MRAAAATWSGEWWKAGGGGSPWDTIVYDPDLDYVYFGTGNGAPWYGKLRGPGDNLYVASIVAVRADNGEVVWHYQTTPDDNWDFDATQPVMLATLTIEGKQRRVLMQANKNGFFYVIDRETVEVDFRRAHLPKDQLGDRCMDAKWRPIENPGNAGNWSRRDNRRRPRGGRWKIGLAPIIVQSRYGACVHGRS